MKLRPLAFLLSLTFVLAGCVQNVGGPGGPGSGRVRAAAAAVLTTPWTAQVSQTLPWPEYPRPQMTRPDWQNLNGKWGYWGGSGAPNAETPPASAPAFPANPEQILVPFPAESYLSGIQRQNQRNLWYKRSFTVPSGWAGRRVRLNFDAVDYQATVYVNGQKVGTHAGGYDAFSFDITPNLRGGSNDLVVGVFDPTYGQAPLGKQTTSPGGIFYTAASGIWQTVWLEPTPGARITRLELTPDPPGGRLKVVVRGEGLSGQTVEATALSGGGQVGSGSGSPGTAFYVGVPNARLWSPDDPFLYDLRVQLRSGGTVVDEVSSYFGMRSLAMGQVNGVARPLLNGRFVYQAGPLDQGYWPDGIYTAPTDEALKFDLQTAKDLGFNMVRKHIKVEPQRWFYWADRLGLLVWQDMPSLAPFSDPGPAARARYEAELQQMVYQHYNSPAVVTWVVFNESWGDFDIARVTNLVEGWDPARWVNAHSGINFAPGDVGAGDWIDLHSYPGPDSPTPTGTRAAALGEFGGSGLKVSGHMWAPDNTFAYQYFPNSAVLTDAYVNQIAKAQTLTWGKGLSALVYTEITDVEFEVNGFLTYDRRVQKMDFARVRSANRALVQGLLPYRPYTFRSVTPGVDRVMRGAGGLGTTEPAGPGSAATLKRETSWKVVPGLADSACVSLESLATPGSYLRHASYRLRLDPGNGSSGFNQDATFCPRAALYAGGGVSLESKNLPGYYVRHRNSELWLDGFQDAALYRQDASWLPQAGLWRSTASLPLGAFRSFRVLTPGFTDRYLRHFAGLVNTDPVASGSPDLLKQDATFRVVAGLADAGCYSLESKNYPGQYVRHRDSRLYKEALDGSQLAREDATFCAQVSPGAQGVRLEAYNFPGRYARHYASEVWITEGVGSGNRDEAASFADDVRWSVENPWSP